MAFYGYQAASRTQGKFSAKDIDKSPAVPPGLTLDTPTAPANQAEPRIDFQPVAPGPTPTPAPAAVPPGYTLDTPTGPANQPEPQIDFQPVAPDPTSTPS